jgi:hypothetical protein
VSERDFERDGLLDAVFGIVEEEVRDPDAVADFESVLEAVLLSDTVGVGVRMRVLVIVIVSAFEIDRD